MCEYNCFSKFCCILQIRVFVKRRVKVWRRLSLRIISSLQYILYFSNNESIIIGTTTWSSILKTVDSNVYTCINFTFSQIFLINTSTIFTLFVHRRVRRCFENDTKEKCLSEKNVNLFEYDDMEVISTLFVNDRLHWSAFCRDKSIVKSRSWKKNNQTNIGIASAPFEIFYLNEYWMCSEGHSKCSFWILESIFNRPKQKMCVYR